MVRKAPRSLHLPPSSGTCGHRCRDTHEAFYFRSLNNEVVTSITAYFKSLPNIGKIAYLVNNLYVSSLFRKEPGQDKCN